MSELEQGLIVALSFTPTPALWNPFLPFQPLPPFQGPFQAFARPFRGPFQAHLGEPVEDATDGRDVEEGDGRAENVGDEAVVEGLARVHAGQRGQDCVCRRGVAESVLCLPPLARGIQLNDVLVRTRVRMQ